MASEEVQGRRIPLRVADHPGLELCNTRAGWGDPHPREYLTDYDTLLIWAGRAGVLDPDEADRLHGLADARPGEAVDVLSEVLAFREELYAVLTWAPAEPAGLSARMKDAVAASTLARNPRGGWSWDGGVGLGLPLRRMVLLAAALLADHPTAAVRRCGGTGCGWLFLDGTGRRRWCVMAICGNRAKARRRADRVRLAGAVTAISAG